MTAASSDCGRFVNSGDRMTMVSTMPAAVTSEASCDLLPAASPVAMELTLASTANPPDQAAGRVGTAQGDELLVGVDVVAVPVRRRHARRERLGQRQEHDAGRAGGQVGQVAQADVGQAGRGHAPGDVADDGHAFVGQTQGGREQDGADDRDERTGDATVDATGDDDDDHRREAQRERGQVGLRQLLHEPDELIEDVPARGLDPEELGQLADRDGDSQAHDEAGDDRFGQELGQEAELEDARGEQVGTDDDGQHGGHGHVRRGVTAGRRGDHRRRHHGHGRAGGHLGVTARAQDGIGGEAGRGGHEADSGRHARQLRVGHGHRHHHGPGGDARGDVLAQPRTWVPRQPLGDGHVAGQQLPNRGAGSGSRNERRRGHRADGIALPTPDAADRDETRYRIGRGRPSATAAEPAISDRPQEECTCPTVQSNSSS